jgi:hypothetical protein
MNKSKRWNYPVSMKKRAEWLKRNRNGESYMKIALSIGKSWGYIAKQIRLAKEDEKEGYVAS